MAESKLITDFKSVRRCSVPIVSIETSDPAATIRSIAKSFPTNKQVPIISWDIVSGMKGLTESGNDALQQTLKDQDPAMMNNPVEALAKAVDFPRETILFILNGHRYIGSDNTNEAAVGQAIWNLRDQFKQNNRTLVILCPGAAFPEELKHDVLVLDEPLPSTLELQSVIRALYKSADLKEPDATIMDKSTDAVRGLSAFAAEQAVAMSLSPKGVDLEKLWERKRKQVEQTPGLSVYRGKETFNDVRGVPVVKEFLTKLFKGNQPPTVLVFMDEIEKMFAGVAGDLSGTSQEQHGEFLRWMQDNEALGIMEVGHPGCTKSFLAKACANEFEVPMVELNMTALKGSLVGQTGLQTRAALKTISAIGRPLVLATSNSLAILPPELKRRFQLGTWFFDLPTKDERKAVWDLYIGKYKISEKNALLPDDSGWTPAEIRTCCDVAWRLNTSLIEAAKFVVPISKSDPEKVEKLRQQAHNRFNNASLPGPYIYKKRPEITEAIREVNVNMSQMGEA